MTHGRRVGAESSLRDAGDMGNNGIDGVFAEIPENGGGVEKFARDGGANPLKSEHEYVTTRANIGARLPCLVYKAAWWERTEQR